MTEISLWAEIGIAVVVILGVGTVTAFALVVWIGWQARPCEADRVRWRKDERLRGVVVAKKAAAASAR